MKTKWNRVADLLERCVVEATPEAKKKLAKEMTIYADTYGRTFSQFLKHPGMAKLIRAMEEGSQ